MRDFCNQFDKFEFDILNVSTKTKTIFLDIRVQLDTFIPNGISDQSGDEMRSPKSLKNHALGSMANAGSLSFIYVGQMRAIIVINFPKIRSEVTKNGNSISMDCI